jgi:hypothetical protein
MMLRCISVRKWIALAIDARTFSYQRGASVQTRRAAKADAKTF